MFEINGLLFKRCVSLGVVISCALILPACAVITVAGAAASVAATAVKTTVKVGAAAVDAVTPDGDSKDKKAEDSTKTAE